MNDKVEDEFNARLSALEREVAALAGRKPRLSDEELQEYVQWLAHCQGPVGAQFALAEASNLMEAANRKALMTEKPKMPAAIRHLLNCQAELLHEFVRRFQGPTVKCSVDSKEQDAEVFGIPIGKAIADVRELYSKEPQ